MTDDELDPSDRHNPAVLAAELAAEPRLLTIEKYFSEIITMMGAGLPPFDDRDPADFGPFNRFRVDGWVMDAQHIQTDGGHQLFDVTLSHAEHGTLFRECEVHPLENPRGCGGSVYDEATREGPYDFVPGIKPGHAEAVEESLARIAINMKMGLLSADGRNLIGGEPQ